MAYCTLNDLKNMLPETELIQLTDDEKLGVVNSGRVDAAIAEASATVDVFARRGGYAVPMTDTALALGLARTLAIYNLMLRRNVVPKNWQTAYDQATGVLKEIAKGTANAADKGAAGEACRDDRSAVFNDEDLAGF